jgi:sulfur carrier protein ThiS
MLFSDRFKRRGVITQIAMSSNDTQPDRDEQSENDAPDHAESDREQEGDITTDQVADRAQAIQDAIKILEDELPPTLRQEVDHLGDAIEAIEDWADEADARKTDALAGAPVIVDAEQERIEHLEAQVGTGQTSVWEKVDDVGDALEELEDVVDAITFTATWYVVYVNDQFIERYDEDSVSVETILMDARKEDPSELGLFPLDGFKGQRQTDQAFPADDDVELSDDHRTFFESTSDGGKIA